MDEEKEKEKQTNITMSIDMGSHAYSIIYLETYICRQRGIHVHALKLIQV